MTSPQEIDAGIERIIAESNQALLIEKLEEVLPHVNTMAKWLIERAISEIENPAHLPPSNDLGTPRHPQ